MELTLENREDRKKAIIVAAIFHAIIAVLFFFFGLTQPVPLPEDTPVAIAFADFGTSMTGSGAQENPDPSQETQSSSAAAAPNEVTTQDSPSDVAMPNVEAEQTTPNTPSPEAQEPAKPTIDPDLEKLLNNPWNTNQEGDGDDDNPGNEGLNTGEKDGSGSLQGAGFSVSGFGGRGLARNPKVTGDPQENGKVVLDVCIDRDGNITKADYNMMQSTTNSSRLTKMAQKAARGAKFTSNPNATFEQCGRMTFIFQLK